MIILDVTDIERDHLATALRRHIAVHGRDAVPDRLAAILSQLEAIGGQPLANGATDRHAALMTYAQAAELLGVSKHTIGRRVADGTLTAVGRRITRTSVEAIQ